MVVVMLALLSCEKLTKYFGGFAVVKDVSFKVDEQIIFGLAGPNGAGKTTLFNLLTGMVTPTSGKVLFQNKEIQHLKPHKIFKLGIARTFQIPTFFPNLTILQNITVGMKYGKMRDDPTKRGEEILKFVELDRKKDVVSRSLSLFDKKRLMIATAMASKPKLLLLDEPIAGLNPHEIDYTMDLIKKISQTTTVIIIEHIMKVIMGLSKNILILDYGQKLIEGTPKEVASDKKVIEAYLGEKYV